MAHQALYRRYRPNRFAGVIGQPHVVAALRNAVAGDKVAHAYLFSGPRGTGKTSTARILAKALNCLDLANGEPCGACDSCRAFADGISYDLHELDAASHNSVDDIRELNSRVLIGSPGRTKVYVLDEVHMLTSSAENALLKTLEEPPSHVVFILCTTEPHKVAQTIRSRTQHLLFGLLPADQLSDHVRSVAEDADIELSEENLAYVMTTGGGSARDTLSALDQVAAAGSAPAEGDSVSEVIAALASGDSAAVLAAADGATRAGQEPRVLAEALLRRLRNAFLASVCGPEHLSPAERSVVGDLVEKMSARHLTHALELLGEALVGMRTAPDPRVDLELALIRLSRSELDVGQRALAARVERLESALAQARPLPADGFASQPTSSVARPPVASSGKPPAESAESSANSAVSPAGHARSAPPPGKRQMSAQKNVAKTRELRAMLAQGQPSQAEASDARGRAQSSREAVEGVSRTESPPKPASARQATAQGAGTSRAGASAICPSRDEVVLAWANDILPTFAKSAIACLGSGRFLASRGNTLRLAFNHSGMLQRSKNYQEQVEASLSRHFNQPLSVSFEIDDGTTADPPESSGLRIPERYKVKDISEIGQPKREKANGIEQMQEAFPGGRLIDQSA